MFQVEELKVKLSQTAEAVSKKALGNEKIIQNIRDNIL
jgi:hypothetical protein